MLKVIFLCFLSTCYSQTFLENEMLSVGSANNQLSEIWNNIMKDTTPHGYYSSLVVAGILIQNNSPTFDNRSDELPSGRKKLIHSEGVVAKVELVITNSYYSGIFSTGSKTAILRLSCASEYNTKKGTPEGALENFIPGLAFKVLVDNADSRNVVAMYDTDGQESWNFFENDFTNSFEISPNPSAAKKQLASKFSQVTPYISSVGVKDFSIVKPDGTAVDPNSVKFPFKLNFIPTSAVSSKFSKNFTEDYKTIIKRIPVGTTIYQVEAIEKPGCDGIIIGYIRSSSLFTTSMYGDTELFFPHSKSENDDSDKNHQTFNQYRDTYTKSGVQPGKNPAGKFCPIKN